MSARIAQPIAGVAQRKLSKCVMISFSHVLRSGLSNTSPINHKPTFSLLLDPRQRTVPATALSSNRFDSLS